MKRVVALKRFQRVVVLESFGEGSRVGKFWREWSCWKVLKRVVVLESIEEGGRVGKY